VKKFLVMSYDADEQQWFLDNLVAVDAETAAKEVERVRPYVIAANAIELDGMKNIVLELAMATPEAIAADWRKVK
jgi:hypothetical protein